MADIDGDGRLDAVFGRKTGSFSQAPFGVLWFHGDGRGGFEGGEPFELEGEIATRALATGLGYQDFAIADLDGDGDLDFARPVGDELVMFRGTGAPGGFESAPVAIGPRCTRPLFCDWDGDGDLDLVALDDERNAIVRRNVGVAGSLRLEDSVETLVAGPCESLSITDWDGDGRPDLCATRVETKEIAGAPDALTARERAELEAARERVDALGAELTALLDQSPIGYTREQWATRNAARERILALRTLPAATVRRLTKQEQNALPRTTRVAVARIHVRER